MITRSTSIVYLSFLDGGSASTSSDMSISITSSDDSWEALIGVEDFDFTVLKLVQASLSPSDCLIFPSHGSILNYFVIADNASLPMFLADFIKSSVLLHSLIL